MDNLIETIRSQFVCSKRNDLFPDFIENIHFPYFKGMERNSVINFNFPLTVLVGENGCGKTSVLQALENCVEGQSFSQRWFSTNVDPITGTERPCFWYTYFSKDAGHDVEVLKTRINKPDNPDYWEPSRPIVKYGMQKFDDKGKPGAAKTRWNGTKRDLIYLDFRAEITAFDKYFYFEDKPYGLKKIQTKQDYIRYYSHYLMSAIKGTLKPGFLLRGCKKIETAIDLTSDEVKIISSILDKNYISIKIIEHSFYKKMGESVYFSIAEPNGNDFSGNYSEAFAGSGESAVAKLIYKISRAKKGTLVLLDEPEVSLHPKAQKQLIDFLLEKIITKGLQIVLSTHSPTIVEKLPCDAINVLSKNENGKFQIKHCVPAAIAFEYIGQTNTSKKEILVEDEAAKQLVIAVLNLIDAKANDSVIVDCHNGGASDLLKDAVVHARNQDENIFIILDGDKKKGDLKLASNISDNLVDTEIEKITGIKCKNLNFIADSGKAVSQILDEKKVYLNYLYAHLTYFSTNDPEEIMWKASTKAPQNFNYSETDYKEVIKKWIEDDMGTEDVDADNFKTYRKKLLQNLIKDNVEVMHLKDLLTKIISEGCVR